ncbi:MAG: hypothetical protein ACRBG0_10185 [Lewinella sp.]|uniref:hypothetical protein n=1 Tax=Lewinella sp. TaxID=2004506 RepID=UPI003D6B5B9D
MKQLSTLLFIFLFCSTLISAKETLLAADRSAELDQQLQLLLPGTGIQEQSVRAYAKERISEMLTSLEAQNIRKKKPHKALAMLREEMGQRFLKNHQPFSKIQFFFTQGQYDQTTASAVYAMTLDYLGMQYLLQVQGTEVSLLVDVGKNTERIRVKGASPLNAENERRFQNAYLEVLRSVGYIPTAEWNNPPDQLFNRYYLGGDQQLSLRQLASFLYYRQALRAYADHAWASSLDWLYQARQLHPWPVQEVLQRAIWLQLATEDTKTTTSLDYLWKIWERSPGAPWQGQLIHRFNELLRDHPAPNSWVIDSTYDAFKERFTDYPGALGQLREIYYLQSARMHAQQGNTVSVMNYMDSLYRYQPNNTAIHEVLAGMLVWSLRKEREFESGLARITAYSKKYPFLTTNSLFQDRHLLYQAERVRYYFDQDDRIKGLHYMEDFKRLAKSSGRTPRYDSWVLTAYLAASNYYYRQNDYRQALNFIEQGRQESPTDAYLDHRADVLLKYLR